MDFYFFFLPIKLNVNSFYFCWFKMCYVALDFSNRFVFFRYNLETKLYNTCRI